MGGVFAHFLRVFSKKKKGYDFDVLVHQATTCPNSGVFLRASAAGFGVAVADLAFVAGESSNFFPSFFFFFAIFFEVKIGGGFL